MKYTYILGFGALLFAVGCATTNLPSGATKVGGGLMIHWAAPKDGTAILVETRTGKTVATKSVSEGDEFEFDVTLSDCSQTLEAVFPVMPTNAQFVLFFVPSPKSD